MSAIISQQQQLGHPLNGLLRITETVTVLNAPAARPVALIQQAGWNVHRLADSDPVTGTVTFSNISAGPWVLVSRDPVGEYQAVALSDRRATPDGSRP